MDRKRISGERKTFVRQKQRNCNDPVHDVGIPAMILTEISCFSVGPEMQRDLFLTSF